MQITKGHTFRAQPTNQQEAGLGRCAGAARYAWNWVLGYCEEEYRVAREAAIAADDYKRNKDGSLVMRKIGKVPPAFTGRGEPRTADSQVRSASTPSKPKMDV